MDSNPAEKKTKQVAKTSGYATLRVKKDTRRKAVQAVEKLNTKDYGARVKVSDYVAFALSLVTSDHHALLQEATLSHEDRLKREHKAYIAEHGMISRDEYLGKRLSGEIPPNTQKQGLEKGFESIEKAGG